MNLENQWREYDLSYQAEQIINSEPVPRSDDLPQPFTLAKVFKNPPPLAEVLIDGVLRQGHKMLLSGPSKAGKSFALMRLCIGIAEGFNWFGNRCRQGKVLYINMEIDNPSCINRFMKIYNAMGLNTGVHPENITIWGLRGHSQPLRQLTDRIIETAQHDYLAIIIDPLYKVMDGDENSNSDISRMVGEFDRVATETGSSIIYAHHFAKGAGGDKAVIDRAAGAGTFARDPDAIVTMTQLDMSEEVNEIHTAWRIEYTLREFPNKKPYDVWFDYPLHKYDPELATEQVETSLTKKKRVSDKIEKKKREDLDHIIHDIVREIMSDGFFYADEFIEKYSKYEDVSDKTIKRRLEAAGYAPEIQKKVGERAKWRPKSAA